MNIQLRALSPLCELKIPLTILEIMTHVDGKASTQLFVFAAISTTVVPLAGFLDSIVYGVDRKLWDALMACMLCQRRKRQDNDGRINGGVGLLDPIRRKKGTYGIQRKRSIDRSFPTEETVTFDDDEIS